MSSSLDWLKTRREALCKASAQDSFNILVYGDYGTGKSTLLSTCRLPLYVFSFDPGGTKLPALQKLRDEGLAILDTDYENENAKKPTVFKAFDKTLTEMKNAKAFENIGTVAIDSLTTFSDAVMNFILDRDHRAGTVPQIQDYYVLQSLLGQVVRELCNLPCDFILTGHISTDKDEVTGRMITSLLVPGKNSQKIPVLFDEVLISTLEMDAKKNPVYSVRLVGDAKYKTSTRQFSGDQFSPYESPDIMALRAKAGKPVEHLQPIQGE